MIDYQYDPLYRLTNANYSGVLSDTFAYSYDSVDNRLTQNNNGVVTNYGYDNANRLTSVNGVTYSWDDNGNLLSDGVNTYVYDQANRLISVNGQTTFAYNGVGDRLRQTVNSTITNYTLDLNTGLTQVLADGTNTYLYGAGRIAQYDTTMQYFGADGLGSVRQMYDPSGVVLANKRYDPFGNVLTTNGTATSVYGYTGEATDATGLVYLRARYMDPMQGRFLTQDAWPGIQLSPVTQQPYLYARNNPTLYVDPSGYCEGPFRFLRNIPGEDINCGNWDLAGKIWEHPRATWDQKLGAGLYRGTMIVTHGTVAIGIAILATSGGGGVVAIGGACVAGGVTGVAGQGIIDEVTGQRSNGSIYAGNAVGGCVSVGMVSPLRPLTASPTTRLLVANTIGGMASSFARQSVDNAISHTQCFDEYEYNLFEVAGEGVLWGGTTWIGNKIGGSIIWRLDKFTRGVVIEGLMERSPQLPFDFPTIDRFDNGVVTSIKTLNLSSQTYQRSSNLRSTIRGYIYKLAHYQGQPNEWRGIRILPHQINGDRILELVIPPIGSAAQKELLQMMQQEARQAGVILRIITFP